MTNTNSTIHSTRCDKRSMDELAGLIETINIEKDDTAETLADKIEKLITQKLQAGFKRIQRKKYQR